jgi:hypothetical protein
VLAVDLHHHPVYLVLQVVTALSPLVIEGLDLLQVVKAGDVGVYTKAQLAQPLERVPVRSGDRVPLVPAELIKPDVKAA